MQFKFKLQNPDASKRLEESEKVKQRYPERIPLIIEKDPTSKIKEIDRTKFLVPNDITVADLMLIIRKKLELEKEASMFMLVNGKTSVTGQEGLKDVYEKYKDKTDGYLYIAYTSELTWG